MRIQRVVEKKESPEGIFNRAMKGAVSYALGNGLTRADVMKKTRNFCGSEYIRVTEEQDSEDEGSRNDSSEESGEEDGVSDDERGQDTPSPKKTATHSNANTAGKTPEGDKSTAPTSTTSSEGARRNAQSEEFDVEDGLSDGKSQQDTQSQKIHPRRVLQNWQGTPKKVIRVRRLPQRQPQKAQEGMHKVKKLM